MTEDVLRRALEPFFTTKIEGNGTGLGLSAVDNFVKQAGGFVTIESRPGAGTTVTLSLPRAAAAGTESHLTAPSDDAPRGDGEVVLVVEDDDRVREVTLKRVEALGYVAEEARSAADARSAKPRRPRLTSSGRSASVPAMRMSTYGVCFSLLADSDLRSVFVRDIRVELLRPGRCLAGSELPCAGQWHAAVRRLKDQIRHDANALPASPVFPGLRRRRRIALPGEARDRLVLVSSSRLSA